MSKEIDYKNREKRREWRRNYCRIYMKKYRKKLKDNGINRTWNTIDYLKGLRHNVFSLLGGEKCCNCGCDVYEILEINHIKGGGRKEHKKKSMKQIYGDIIKGRVKREDYNILCRVCNANHYVNDILKIKGHNIIWNKPH